MDPVVALKRIAYLLERERERNYRVRAYRNAAAVIAELPDGELERRVRAGTLQDLPGIGEKTERVIVEAVNGEFPPSLRFLEEAPSADLVFTACLRFDKALEVNSRPERLDPPRRLLTRALEMGCKLAIDTDAHAPGQLEWQPYGCERAAECGAPPDAVVNTWEEGRLLAWTAAHPA